jgi:hypothetical protein
MMGAYPVYLDDRHVWNTCVLDSCGQRSRTCETLEDQMLLPHLKDICKDTCFVVKQFRRD